MNFKQWIAAIQRLVEQSRLLYLESKVKWYKDENFREYQYNTNELG